MPVWEAMRSGLEAVVESVESDPVGALRATRVMIRAPSLRARSTQKHLAWITVLEPLVAQALTTAGPDRRYQARAVSLCALACLVP
jgi:hypothetical protein